MFNSKFFISHLNKSLNFKLGNWEKQQNNLKHFIKTKTKTPIYYLPKEMDPKSEQLLAESVAAIQGI